MEDHIITIAIKQGNEIQRSKSKSKKKKLSRPCNRPWRPIGLPDVKNPTNGD
jgi:hypothetical protein